jgi:Protein of unknown function (DUF4232)
MLRLLGPACCTALALAGCSASAAPARPAGLQATPGRTTSPTVTAAIRCTSAMLRIRAGREGENEGAHGDIEFTNIGSQACVLRGLPRLAIVRADGIALQVRQVPDFDLSLRSVVLPAGRADGADLVVHWANWCGRPPGHLSVRVMLQAGGVAIGAFNGPPDYDFVPACISSGQPSTISVVTAYEAGPAG